MRCFKQSCELKTEIFQSASTIALEHSIQHDKLCWIGWTNISS